MKGCVKAKIWHNETEWKDRRIQIVVFPETVASFAFSELDLEVSDFFLSLNKIIFQTWQVK